MQHIRPRAKCQQGAPYVHLPSPIQRLSQNNMTLKLQKKDKLFFVKKDLQLFQKSCVLKQKNVKVVCK